MNVAIKVANKVNVSVKVYVIVTKRLKRYNQEFLLVSTET